MVDYIKIKKCKFQFFELFFFVFEEKNCKLIKIVYEIWENKGGKITI